MPAKGITVYLPKDLEAKVKLAAIDQHRSESSLIAEAVRFRLGRHASQPIEPVSEQHYVSRLDARLQKLVGESLIIKEVVLLFIRIWLEHNPPIDEAHEDAAAASAEARFERFLELVRNGLEGRSLANGAFTAAPSSDHADADRPPP